MYTYQLYKGNNIEKEIHSPVPMNLHVALPYGIAKDEGDYFFVLLKDEEIIQKTKFYTGEEALHNLLVILEFIEANALPVESATIKPEESKGEKKASTKAAVIFYIVILVFAILSISRRAVTEYRDQPVNLTFSIILTVGLIIGLFVFIKKKALSTFSKNND